MKPQYLSELEDLDLDHWNLKEETSTTRIYQKEKQEKRIQVFSKYTVEENSKDGKLHGYLIGRMNKPFFHYPKYESKIYLIEKYHEGKKEGISESFYEDGAKVQETWKNDELHGKWTEWFANGQKEKEKNYVDGQLDGTQYEWYENGQLKLEENFTAGVQTCKSSKFLENGLLKRSKSYQDGKIEGTVYELWDFRGNVIDGGVYSESEYRNDIQHGKEVVYYPDKTKMREGSYQEGKLEGERIWWNKNGTISIKEYYKNDELDGQRFLYTETGELESVQQYQDGVLIS